MSNGLYGNEWINYDQNYFRIEVEEDGIYRLDQRTLSSAGIPSNVEGRQFQLILRGEEVPLYVSSTGTLGSSDFIEFYGRRNRAELDKELYYVDANVDNATDTTMLNPEYSLFSDISVYYLTWTDATSTARYSAINNDLSNLPTKENNFSYRHLEVYTKLSNGKSGFVKPTINRDGGAYSYFSEGEGFASTMQQKNAFTIEPEAVDPAGGNAEVYVRWVGDRLGHDHAVYVDGSEVFRETFSGFKVKEVNHSTTANAVSDGVEVRVEGMIDNTDRNAVSMISVTYPRTFDFGGGATFSFEMPASPSRRYLEIENFSTAGTPILYDVVNRERIEARVEGNLIKVVLPSSVQKRVLVLASQNEGVKTATLQPTNFADYENQEAQYIIITNQALFDDGNGTNHVEAYANYRASIAGGNYESLIVDIDQLYEQFAYGIKNHPLAIRNFGHYITDKWSDARYILLMGKGREYNQMRTPADEVSSEALPMLIPTYGSPGSDNLMLGDHRSPTTRIPIGRLSFNEGREIDVFLRKIKAFEANVNLPQTIDDRAWMKRIIHLGGGDPRIQTQIRNNLESMANIIENNQFGGDVSGFYKNSADVVQISTSDQIFDLINGGVSVITFFGHSGANTFDFNIDNPDNYKNRDKYPMMFSLGCFIGNIHTHFQGVSERFTFDEDAGAIGFGASTSLGFVPALNRFMQNYYGLLGGELYGAGIGNILQENLKRLQNQNTSGLKELKQQFTLHGDPALRLNVTPGPDFVIDSKSIVFNPGIVAAQAEKFELTFEIVNIGKAISDSITIKIEQQFPDGNKVTPVIEKIEAPIFKRTMNFEIPVYGKTSVGENKLFITVDADNDVEEKPLSSAELNNELEVSGQKGLSFFIIDNGVEPIYPTEFGIVNDPFVTLISSTLDALAKENKFIVEIDTTEKFNSNLKQSTVIQQSGGLIKWQPNMPYDDGVVYYWRISPDSVDTQVGYVWENSSFVYLPNETEGWNQSHFFQFEKNEFDNLSISESTRKFSYGNQVKDFKLKTNIWDPNDKPVYLNEGNAWEAPWRWTINAGFQVIVRYSNTLKYWINEGDGLYGSFGRGRMVSFPYKTNTAEQRSDFITFLEDVIPDGSYVLIYSTQRNNTDDYSPELWSEDLSTLGKSIYTVLENEGASKVRELETKGSIPYAVLYQKGIGLLKEDIAEDIDGTAIIEHGLRGLYFEGNTVSKVVGPAKEWNNVSWSDKSFDDPINDTTWVDIYGVDSNSGIDTLLFDSIRRYTIDISEVDAGKFPYLRLIYNSKDIVNRSSPSLSYWRVNYKGLPDIAVAPNQLFVVEADSVQQGESYTLRYAIENVSPYPIDSVLVEYKINSESSDVVEIVKKSKPMNAWEKTELDIEVKTDKLTNLQALSINLNADQAIAERTFLNNYILTRFFVDQDNRNPLLDVTFDGEHIIDGDIVSPSPMINISLQDDNPFLQLQDTGLFRIYLNYPDGSTKRINFSDDIVTFYPASRSKNQASIELNPLLELDGSYSLTVQAEDATGNQSGDLDYKVNFEVINKKSISNLLNYPNPFSTSTQFVYTLTGDEIPQQMMIQIFTISGRIVKEINQNELGPLKIGTNRTDYTWDGTDDYGNKLANGVYLYRVVAKNANGEDFESFGNSTDRFFKNGFGKMVILR